MILTFHENVKKDFFHKNQIKYLIKNKWVNIKIGQIHRFVIG